jgi:hypothetical protein
MLPVHPAAGIGGAAAVFKLRAHRVTKKSLDIMGNPNASFSSFLFRKPIFFSYKKTSH